MCMEYDAAEGASIMVDGFRIAAELKRTAPKIHADLTRIDVTGIYKGDGVVLQRSALFSELTGMGIWCRSVFSNYDRDTVTLPKDGMRALYAGIRAFDRLANDPRFQWRYTLQPGDMLVFDNWRILHGRGPFGAGDKMAGSYINREDYESALRVNGLT